MTQKEKYDLIVKKKSAHIIGIYDFHHFEEKNLLIEKENTVKKIFFRTAATLLCFLVLFTLTGCKSDETEKTAKKLFSEKWSEITSGETFPAKICVKGYDYMTPSSFSKDVEVFGWLCRFETKQTLIDECKKLNIKSVSAGGSVFIPKYVDERNYNITFYDTDDVVIMELNVDYTGIVTIKVYGGDGYVYVLNGTGLDYDSFKQFVKTDEREG